MRRIASVLAVLALGATSQTAAAAVPAAIAAKARTDILIVIASMEHAWNNGDFRGYMAGFENPGVRFVSNGRMSGGWQQSLDNYVRGYGGSPDRRGHLHFYDITIDVYAPDAALLISHYHLERPVHPQEGINTRLFRKVLGHWVIDMNHVSSFEAHAGDPDTEGLPRQPPSSPG